MEQAVIFGPGDALIGVFSDPPGRRPDSPIVLLANAGVLPRQGPHRLNVRVARALARQGIGSFRFDISGHGDSLPISNPAGIRAQAQLDFKSAMDWVQRETGNSRFFVFGICSGAINAYDIALTDERVAGILMFDGFWYHSRWSRPMRHFKRAMNADWRQRLTAVRRRLLPSQPRDVATASAPAANLQMIASPALNNPPLAEYADAMQRIVDRGTDVMVVYGGTIIDQYSYAGQFRDVFGAYPFYSRVRCEYHPEIDHTFMTRRAQDRMTQLVCSWADRPRALP